MLGASIEASAGGGGRVVRVEVLAAPPAGPVRLTGLTAASASRRPAIRRPVPAIASPAAAVAAASSRKTPRPTTTPSREYASRERPVNGSGPAPRFGSRSGAAALGGRAGRVKG